MKTHTGGRPKEASTASDVREVEGRRTQVWPWVLRISWFALALALAPLLSHALGHRSAGVRVTVAALAWVWWVAGLLAALVPYPLSLVALRVGGAGAVVAATLAAKSDAALSQELIGLGAAFAAATVAMVSETGHLCVNGPAYPNERRFLLRPSALALVLVPIAGAVVLGGVVAGPLLLAVHRWVVGAAVLVVGLAAASVCARALFVLTRRFVVFVPAGFVVHDGEALRDPVLFQRGMVEAIRAAPAGSDSLDLTANAPGLAIEVLLHEKVEITKVRSSRDIGETGRTARFLIVPTLPGRLVRTAAARGYATTAPTPDGA